MYCIELEFEDENLCYIDGKGNYVLSPDEIPNLYADIISDVKVNLAETHVKQPGKPDIILSCHNDKRLQNLITSFMTAFIKSSGKIVTRASAFDREHLAITIFDNFNKMHKCFFCTLKPEQYKGLKDFKLMEDFKLLKKYEPYANISLFELETETQNALNWVAESRYDLKNPNQDSYYPVRVALVVHFVGKKANLIPILSNLPQKTAPDISKVAMHFFSKPRYQDNIFVNLMKAIKSDETLASFEPQNLDETGTPKKDLMGKKRGVSIRPQQEGDDLYISPYTRVRSLADDIWKKRDKNN